MGNGLIMTRYFTKEGNSVKDMFQWTQRDIQILSDTGSVIFSDLVEAPDFWSDTAVQIAASKYFCVDSNGKRESSIWQMICRVVDKVSEFACDQRYFDSISSAEIFADELKYIFVNQMAAMNSPVWFNFGAYGHDVQSSACYILGVEDSIDSIMTAVVDEASIFKNGSGAGMNLSKLRASCEQLSSGGKSSGPVSFMHGYNSIAGTIKSGGKTRRAALMIELDADHPDIKDFIVSKSVEEYKAHLLLEIAGIAQLVKGVDTDLLEHIIAKSAVDNVDAPETLSILEKLKNNELVSPYLSEFINQHNWSGFNDNAAYSTVGLQNMNISVSIPDSFMRKVTGKDPDTSWYLYGRKSVEIPKTTVKSKKTECAQGTIFTINDTTYICLSKNDHRIVYSREDAVALLTLIAEAAWQCGDPGVQFIDRMNEWFTAKNSGTIRGTNPCGEVDLPDNTSCNLASLKLTKFSGKNGKFDISAFAHVVRLVFVAQDAVINPSHYPTDLIHNNTMKYRAIGMGIADVGTLLMQLGLPYDSEDGRNSIAAIMSLMTSVGYLVSAEMAELVGESDIFEDNKESVYSVLDRHFSENTKLLTKLTHRPNATEVAKEAERVWKHLVTIKPSVRNMAATCIAPTGCLVGNSLVTTNIGLVPLSSIGNTMGDQWQDININVSTDNGEQLATKFYINGLESVVSVETKNGYTITGTPQHRIKIIDNSGKLQWKRLGELTKGDYSPLYLKQRIGKTQIVNLPELPKLHFNCNQETTVPKTMTPDLAELIGYFMGDGSIHDKELRFAVTNGDTEITNRLCSLSEQLFNLKATISQDTGYHSVNITSVPIVQWWKNCNFAKKLPSVDHSGKGYIPHVPSYVLLTNDNNTYSAFLRGLYNADGSVFSAAGSINLSSVDRSFLCDVQSILLYLGIPTRLRCSASENSIGRFSKNKQYNLSLVNVTYNSTFVNNIGITCLRKLNLVNMTNSAKANKNDQIPFSRENLMLCNKGTSTYRTICQSLRRDCYITRMLFIKGLENGTIPSELAYMLDYYYDHVESITNEEAEMTYDLSVPSNVTYIANGFISHNTIGLLMDCQTTGIEPDFSLVKYKRLVGGGMMQFVNDSVNEALRVLGYSPEEREALEQYVKDNGHLENSCILKAEDLPVFDCAGKAQTGNRIISAFGHIDMMAAVQPFVSMSISKTVNLSETCTINDIVEAYSYSWEKGLKAIALYRDKSKRIQPLSSGLGKESSQLFDAEIWKEKAEELGIQSERKKLSDNCPTIRHKFSIGGHEGYLHCGMYDNGKLGEIFVRISKEGSTISGVIDAFATMFSIALQRGTPLDTLVQKFAFQRFEPSGWTKCRNIPKAESVVDYIVRWLAFQFLSREEAESIGVQFFNDAEEARDKVIGRMFGSPEPKIQKQVEPEVLVECVEPKLTKSLMLSSDAPTCNSCGSQMTRAGSCYTCRNCGSSSGCG